MDILKLLQQIDKGHQPTEEQTAILLGERVLNLSHSGITSLPESIGQLANLKTIDLDSTPLTSLPESIGQLSDLRMLFLNNSKISTLPESISHLSRLYNLSSWHGSITALPESFGQLGILRELNLRANPITILPESIGQLANLQRLDLMETKISVLPSSIGQLSNLKALNLQNAPIKVLPDSIGQLAKLQELNLYGTQITTLPESIGQLANLRALYLSGTKINKLPDSVGQLSNLQSIYLRNTPITTLPESIGQLSNLQTIDLAGTGIQMLPEWFEKLSTLRHLDLQGLTLPSIPKALALRGLRFVEVENFYYGTPGINLYGVTLTKQDKSVFLEHPELIPDLYKEEDLLPVRECRVIFLGDGASGKSYTIKRFRNKGKRETDLSPYITFETPGVEILDYHEEREAESFDVHFWDFGGQQLLHSMHRCFLSEDSCYVVTVKTRETKASERARYWLRNVTAFAPKSPILLFVNCWEDDNGRRAIDESGLRKEFPMIRGVIYCSAKLASNADFRQKLMRPVLEMAASSAGCTKQVPKQWIAVRNAIETESRETNYLTKTRYHEICAENEIEDEQAPELLSFFNSLGVCFSYHQDEHKKELEEYKLLSPVWLTNALYAIIEEGMAPAQDGRITDKVIRQMLCNPPPIELEGKPHTRTAPDIQYNKEECPWILAVAEAHDLCYRVDSTTLFFPALCGTDTPKNALTAPEFYPQHVSYLLRYAYLPDSVLHQLIIRCMRNSLTVDTCWLKGMILKVWNLHQAYVRMVDEESLRIDIYSTGTHPAYELFWLLRKELFEVNRKLNLCAEEFILDGKDEFPLEAILVAAKENADVYGRSGKRNAETLLERFYEISVWQFMRVENGMLHIPIPSREYHPCAKSNRSMRYALFEAYNRLCPYCNNPISTIREMEVDHILPSKYTNPPALKPYVDYLTTCGFDIEKPDYIENYFPSHQPCNKDKKNRVNEYSLPYWHDIAAQHAPRIIRLMEQYKGQNRFDDDGE